MHHGARPHRVAGPIWYRMWTGPGGIVDQPARTMVLIDGSVNSFCTSPMPRVLEIRGVAHAVVFLAPTRKFIGRRARHCGTSEDGVDAADLKLG